MIERIFLSDHFLLGLGLAVGPALIILGIVFIWFKWGNPLKKFTNDNPVTKPLWDKLNVIEGRQISLREELPKEYVRNDRLEKLDNGLERIEKKLDHFMEDCRKGQCSAGRLQALRGEK